MRDQDWCGHFEPERFDRCLEVLKRLDLEQFAGGDHREDRFHKPSAYCSLDTKTDLPVDHQFPKLAFRLIVCRFHPFHLGIPKVRSNGLTGTWTRLPACGDDLHHLGAVTRSLEHTAQGYGVSLALIAGIRAGSQGPEPCLPSFGNGQALSLSA